MQKILIIEDDLDLQEGLAFSLEAEGYKTVCAARKEEGLARFIKEGFELILLDCNLPDGNGFDLCKELRSHSKIPILMLTARDTEIDEVKALELGADDYMTKPFSLAVLKARIKKLLQRGENPRLITSGSISIDKDSCKVFKETEEIACSKVEYRLLLYFMEHKNQVLSKEQILERIWDKDGKFVDENIVSVNIRRLRTKIEADPTSPEYLKTVYGLGYLWKEN